MRQSVRLGGLGVAALTAFVIAEVAGSSVAGNLGVIAAAIAAGELIVLRPYGRNPLPLSFAIFTVLVRAATPVQFIVVVVLAELAAAAIRPERVGIQDRTSIF